MTSQAALDLIRQCVDEGRIVVKDHFTERLAERGLFWGDVLALLHSPATVWNDGLDEFGRERWLIAGRIAPRWSAEILCTIQQDGPVTIFITLYWI
jgi:hypothetical protein